VKADFLERGGLWVLGQFSLLIFALLAGVFWSANWKNTPIRALGWLFIAAGAFCGLCGVRALGRNLTPFTKPSAKAALVTTGIYGWMRHPLYTAVGSGVIGWALVRESVPALLCAGLLLALLDRKARREEAHLISIFAEYEGYAKRVKAFIPWLY
jgi:protein-S-isoprenylcysteine O-methyltransferase Ste14